jgi:acyl-coenzyme A thioesterase PaaI-like protein
MPEESPEAPQFSLSVSQTVTEERQFGKELHMAEEIRRPAMSATLSLYVQFSKYPMGNTLFSKALSFRAPYFSTIHPRVTELRSGHCTVEIKDRRSIRNHLGSIHAGALCTLAELTGGLAVEATLPSNLRWIPKGMTVQYIKKAKGRLVGRCSVDPDAIVPGDLNVPLEISDDSGESVMNAVIVFYISERRDKNRAA